jgi:hypothetical protein
MRARIEEYVRHCTTCSRVKATNKAPPGLFRARIATAPMRMVCVDHMGPYPLTHPRRNRFILVVTCLFSRLTELYAVPDATARTTITTLENEFFRRYGYPEIILSDNGPAFRQEWEEAAVQSWGARVWKTAIYSAHQNPTERRNREIKAMLRISLLDKKKHNTWDQYLSSIRFHLLNRVNKSTGFSPAQIIYGKPLTCPKEQSLNLSSQQEQELGDWYDLHWSQVEAMRSDAANRMASATKSYVEDKNDRRREAPEYQPGEMVWVRNRPQSDAIKKFSEKLAEKWRGPIPVHAKAGKDVYAFEEAGIPPYKLSAADMKPCLAVPRPPGGAPAVSTNN